jgi:hypothetical protein
MTTKALPKSVRTKALRAIAQVHACCAGFWRRHRDRFTLGQLAQRLGWVRKVRHATH